jgi:hypothetical protein
MAIMTVADLIKKLSQVPQHLDVQVMADHRCDLANIDSVELIAEPFSDESFVVIELLNRACDGQDPQHVDPDSPEFHDNSSVSKLIH